MTQTSRTLPSFIGIGPGRTGTSFIYEVLRHHPEVRMAHGTKETNYFSHEYHRGPDWYAAFFEGTEAARAVGEIANVYFYDPAVPARIHELLPDVRLFSCLRNPFERLRSVFLYRQRSHELPGSITLNEAVAQDPDLTAHSRYATLWGGYRSVFPDAQRLLLFYDDLEADPEAFIEQLLRFIRVSPTVDPERLATRVNPSAVPRSRLVSGLAAGTSRVLRQVGLLGVLDAAKRTAWIRKAVLKPAAAETRAELMLNDATASRLLEAWTPEVRQIESWTGRSLDHWLVPNP